MQSIQSLSNDELRRNLQSLGIKVGPITESTRSVYENRLIQLSKDNIDKNKENSSSRQKKKGFSIKTEEPITVMQSPTSHDSHGDSIENEPVGVSSQHTESQISHQNRNQPISQTVLPHDTLAHRTPTNAVMSAISNRSNSSLNTTESDLTRTRFQFPVTSRNIVFENQPQQHNEPSFNRPNNSPHQYSPLDGASIGRFSIFSKYLLTESAPPSATQSNQPRLTSWSSYSPEQRQNSSPQFPRNVSSRFSSMNNSVGVSGEFKLSSLCKLLGFSRMDRHIPNIILFSGLLLLTVLISSYLLLNDKNSSIERFADLQNLVCTSDLMENIDFRNCVHEVDLPTVLHILKVLFEILSRYSGEHLCGQSAASPRMELTTAKHLVFNQLILQSEYKVSQVTSRVWDSALLLIRHLGRKHFGIVAYSLDGDVVDEIRTITEVEGLMPYIPGKCRLQRLLSSLLSLLMSLVWICMLIIFLGCSAYGVYRFLLFKKRRDERRLVELHEIVQNVISLLHQQLKKHLRNHNEPPFLPVLRIKEALAHSFNNINTIWPSVEISVYRYEGDILVQEWRGLGETWQWNGGHVLSEPRSFTSRQSNDPTSSHPPPCGISSNQGVLTQSQNSHTLLPAYSDANVICSSQNNWYWRWGYSLNYPPQ